MACSKIFLVLIVAFMAGTGLARPGYLGGYGLGGYGLGYHGGYYRSPFYGYGHGYGGYGGYGGFGHYGYPYIGHGYGYGYGHYL